MLSPQIASLVASKSIFNNFLLGILQGNTEAAEEYSYCYGVSS